MFTSSLQFIIVVGFFSLLLSGILKTINDVKSIFSTSKTKSSASSKHFEELARHYDVQKEYHNYKICGYESEKAFEKALQLKRHTKETRKDTPAYEYTDGLIEKYKSLADMWNTLTSDEVKNIHFHRLQGYSFLLGSVTRNGDSATLHWVMQNKDKDVIDLFDTVESL